MKPVLRGMCSFESLKNGSIDLADITLMNDAIDVEEDNKYLVAEWRASNE